MATKQNENKKNAEINHIVLVTYTIIPFTEKYVTHSLQRACGLSLQNRTCLLATLNNNLKAARKGENTAVTSG